MSPRLRSVLFAVLLALAAPRTSLGGPRAPGFLAPGRGAALAPGAIIEVRWTSLCSRGRPRSDEAEIVLSLDGGLTFPIRVSGEISPCETRLLWRVPALSTGRARLALRTGEGGFFETETIALVSGNFRIFSDLDHRVQELYRRAAEWWTPPEIGVLTAKDLLGGALSPASGRLSRAEETSAAASPQGPKEAAASVRICGAVPRPPRRSSPSTAFAAPNRLRSSTPLRL